MDTPPLNNTDTTDTQDNSKQINPLPYTIVFTLLFIVTLGVLTWTLGKFNQRNQCALYPNIWCSDNWNCNTSCTGGTSSAGPVNNCFSSVGPTGLGSCLFGPNAPGATVCLNPPTGTSDQPSCDCPNNMQSTPSCFSGCGQSLDDISGLSGLCCCSDVNNPNCTVSACGGN